MPSRPVVRLLAIGILLLAALATIAVLSVHGLRWRTHVILIKLQGDLPELSWTQLVRMLPPGGPHHLESITNNRSAYATIRNPWGSDADAAAGAERFAGNCASCHDAGGTGGSGPDLTRPGKHGGSDWAVFRIIQNGVPGTAMPAHDLNDREIWQVVAHVQRLRRGAPATDSTTLTWRPDPVSWDQLKSAGSDSANWLLYHGSMNGWRFSRATQMDTANVDGLKLLWMHQVESRGVPFETTPLIAGSTMFLTEPRARVVALDAHAGTVRWSYEPELPEQLHLCCGPVNRGVALLDSMVYVATPDARLVALHVATGRPLWTATLAEHSRGYSLTSAPLVVGDLVVIGIAGGEYGIRGFIDAYDAKTGTRAWRFHTIPAPGAPGSETWGGNAAETGGGPAWLTGTYDPELGLVYFGTGNPGPVYDGTGRPGDNLYTNSVVALRQQSGELVWYFQFTPHDVHDYDAAQVPLLVDAPNGGQPRRLMLAANKNGFYYVLDRTNGKFLLGIPFARQTWARGLDSTGRPIPAPEAASSETGVMVWPSQAGATNWWPPSYSPASGLVYIPTREQGAVFFNQEEKYEAGENYLGSRGHLMATEARSLLRAVDAMTGERRWEFQYPPSSAPSLGGVLSTAGGLVFHGAGNTLVALHHRTGAVLWRFNAGGYIRAAPMTWISNGNQRVTVAAGSVLLTFGLK